MSQQSPDPLDGETAAEREAAFRRMMLPLASLLLYILLFALLFPQLGSSVAALAILPVLLSGWTWGQGAGIVAGLLAVLLNTALLNLLGESGWNVLVRTGGLPGSLAILMAGAGAGWGQTLYRRHEQEIARHRQTEMMLRRRNRELQLLNRVITTAHSRLDPVIVLGTVCRELARAFDLPQASAAILDEGGETLTIVAEYASAGSTSVLGEQIPLSDRATAQVVAERRPLAIDDALTDPRLATVRDLVRRRKVASMLLLPLQVGDEVVGTVGLDAVTPHHFSVEEMRLATTATAAAAPVLQKAELLQRTHRQAAQLRALRDVQLQLSRSLEPQRVYEAIVQHAARLLPSAAVCLYRRRPHAATYEQLACYGSQAGDGHPPGRIAAALPADGESSPGLFTLYDAPRAPHTSLVVPLRYRERLTGFLIFYHAQAHRRWPEAELSLAESVAAQAAIAMANARLHAQTRADAETVQQLLDTIPDAVILLNGAHEIVKTNRQGRAYLEHLAPAGGHSLAELGGRELAAFLGSSPAGREGHEIRLEGKRERIFEVRAAAAPEGWVLVIRDVTRERAQQQQLQAQARLAAVGQLSAGIAHDFNNILSSIILFTELLQRSPRLNEKDGQRLQIILNQAEDARVLVHQILDFSRRSLLRREPLDLVALCREAFQVWERTLSENICLHFESESPRYIVNADAATLRQALLNLVLNAQHAMPQGGALRLALTHREGNGAEAAPPGPWVRLTLSDTGAGIAPEDLPHIFEPFFTTKGGHSHSGLGLAQVHGIVGQHEGQIAVASEMGAGSTFTIHLPLIEAPGDSGRDDATAAAPSRPATILLVEDEAPIREALAEALTLFGHRVHRAGNCREARDQFHAHQADLDLVISDLVMPDGSGVDLYRQFSAHHPPLKMLLLTGYPLRDDGEEMLAEGIAAWMQKPVAIADLEEAVSGLLDS